MNRSFHPRFFLGLAAVLAIASPAGARAQDESWKHNVEMNVERVRATELPRPSESVLPQVLNGSQALPKPASLDQLRETAAALAPMVVEVLAITTTRGTLPVTPMLTTGHAVWLSGEDAGTRPVLVTSFYWLEEADEIYVRPLPPAEQGALPAAEVRSFQDSTDRGRISAIRRDKRAFPVQLLHADRHRNLTVLGAKDAKRWSQPAGGVQFFPLETQSAARVYGFSPFVGPLLVETAFLPPKDSDEAMVFYLQCSFSGRLGAPIVSADGRVIAITAMAHPKEKDRTLVVPPLAVRTFVAMAQGVDDPHAARGK